MGRKLVSAQKSFRMVVANLRTPSDPSRGPSGNPTVYRQGFSFQRVFEMAGRGPTETKPENKGLRSFRAGLAYPSAAGPQNATGKITVSSAVFLGPTVLVLGEYEIMTDRDFVVDPASASNTAAALAVCINNLTEYTAVPAGVDVNIIGPVGIEGNFISFRATGASPANFTLTPATGTLESAEPEIGPVIIK